MSTTLEIYRDLMKAAEPTHAKGARILEVVRLWHEEVLELGHYLRGCAPSIVVDELPTFTWEGTDATCTVHEKWNGTIDIGGERLTLAQAMAAGMTTDRGGGYHALVLSDDRLVTVDLGSTAFVARMVEPERRLRSRIRIDTPFVGVMATVGTLFFAVMALVLTTPPMPEVELLDVPDRTDVTILVPPPPRAPAPTKPEEVAAPDESRTRTPARAPSPADKRRLDREIAESAGILQTLAALEGQLGNFEDALRGAGNLIGPGSPSQGDGVWTARRGPIGGGGTIDQIADVGTKRGPGYGSEGTWRGDKPIGDFRIADDPITVRGSLGRAEIDAVVKQHLASIRYCYERQLPRAPDLAGKVSIKFVISKSGAVSRAVIDSSTVNDAELESCLQSRFLRMQFPEPRGGGIVIVSYPFLFSPG